MQGVHTHNAPPSSACSSAIRQPIGQRLLVASLHGCLPDTSHDVSCCRRGTSLPEPSEEGVRSPPDPGRRALGGERQRPLSGALRLVDGTILHQHATPDEMGSRGDLNPTAALGRFNDGIHESLSPIKALRRAAALANASTASAPCQKMPPPGTVGSRSRRSSSASATFDAPLSVSRVEERDGQESTGAGNCMAMAPPSVAVSNARSKTGMASLPRLQPRGARVRARSCPRLATPDARAPRRTPLPRRNAARSRLHGMTAEKPSSSRTRHVLRRGHEGSERGP